jgi:hypothetical protein
MQLGRARRRCAGRPAGLALRRAPHVECCAGLASVRARSHRLEARAAGPLRACHLVTRARDVGARAAPYRRRAQRSVAGPLRTQVKDGRRTVGLLT